MVYEQRVDPGDYAALGGAEVAIEDGVHTWIGQTFGYSQGYGHGRGLDATFGVVMDGWQHELRAGVVRDSDSNEVDACFFEFGCLSGRTWPDAASTDRQRHRTSAGPPLG